MKTGESFLNEHINRLISRHNNTKCHEAKNLAGHETYLKIMKPLCTELGKNEKLMEDAPTGEIRERIIKSSKAEENIRSFLSNSKMIPGAVIGFGTLSYEKIWTFGNRMQVPEEKPINEDTIFDLASITKLFTSISIFRLREEGKLDFNEKIGDFDERFKNIKDVTISELLGFQVPLITKKRIDQAGSRQEAKELLFGISIDKKRFDTVKPYTDMGAMVLKYVIEAASGKSFEDYIKSNILIPCGMENTYFNIPFQKRDLAACNNFERRIAGGIPVCFDDILPGVVNDPKARIFAGEPQGHAGLFSTAGDMMRLAAGLLTGKVLPIDIAKQLSENRTGRKLSDGKTVQYLGHLCHSKSPLKEFTEIYHPLSGTALAASGYTGCSFTVDFENEFYYFLGTAKCHNRVTSITSQEGKGEEEKLKLKDGALWCRIGDEMFVCVQNFARVRAPMLKDPVLDLLFQLRFAEEYFLDEQKAPNRFTDARCPFGQTPKR